MKILELSDTDRAHPILKSPHTYDLVRIDWKLGPFGEETFMDLTFKKDRVTRILRFSSPSKVKVDEGYNGQGSGLEILDISRRGWDRKNIMVNNFENSAGITFYAADVMDLGESGD